MNGFEIQPLSAALGAELRGLDLAAPLPQATARALQAAFLEHHVLVIRSDDDGARFATAAGAFDHARLLAFARHFGEPELHAIVEGEARQPEVIRVHKPRGQAASFGVGWHSDNSFQQAPTGATVLFARTVPPSGGDTLFANMERAFEALSPPLQRRLADLRARHSARRAYDPALVGAARYRGEGPLRYRYSDAVEKEVVHPLLRRDPRSGRRALFVNQMFTLRIEGLPAEESTRLLDFLYAHGANPAFGCRVRWTPGSVVVWDNRCVWHCALDDYQAHERLMYRVTLAGERPL